VVPVARSGNKGKGRIACYRCPKNKPREAEGVAGQTWAQEKTLVVYDLPDLRDKNASSDDYKKYAEHTWISAKRAKKDKPSACSLIGILLEVKGIPWGAIVLDSRSKKAISTTTALNQQRFKTLNTVLSKLHE